MRTEKSDRCRHAATISRGSWAVALASLWVLGAVDRVQAASYTGASNGAWLTSTNWTPSGVPGSADEALFAPGNTATGVGIDMGGATNNGAANQIVGKISLTGGANRGIGNSSTTTDGTLTLNGVGGVLIENSSTNNLTLQNTVTPGNKLMSVEFANAGAINLSGTGAITISSVISGNNGFTKTGTGTGLLTLSGANTFSGGVTLNEGSLALSNASALGTGALTINGGVLRASSGYTITNDAVWNGNFIYGSNNTFTFNSANDLSLGTASGTSRTIEVSGGANSVVAVNSKVVSGTTATRLIKTGANVLRLNNNANSFSNLTVNGGAVSHVSTVTGNTGTTLTSPIDIGSPFGTGAITLDGGSISWSGATSGSGTAYREFKNSVILQGNGTVQPYGYNRVNHVLSGTISGDGKLTLNSNPDGGVTGVFLTQTNTYEGGTNLNITGTGSSARGVFVADAVNAFGGGASGVGGQLTFTNNSNVSGQSPSFLILKANQSVAGIHGIAPSNGLSRHYIIGNDVSTARTLTLDTTAGGEGDGSTLLGYLGGPGIGIDNNTTNTSGIATAGANNLAVVKNGSGSQRFTNISTYSGGTVVNGGTLWIDAARAELASRTATFTNNSNTLTNIDTTGLVVGQRASSSPNGNHTNQFIVSILSPTSLVISGGASASGSGTYTFAAGSSTGTGDVTVSATGTIAGNGGVYGVLTVNTGGTVAPGNSIGTMTTGGLNLDGGTYAAEINTITPGADRLAVTGNITLTNAVLSLSDLGANEVMPDDTELVLMTYSGTLSGVFTGRPDDSTFTFGANQFRIDYNDTADSLNAVTLTVVPEPATIGLLGLGVAGLATRRRRA